jgi:hypothetical protein
LFDMIMMRNQFETILSLTYVFLDLSFWDGWW